MAESAEPKRAARDALDQVLDGLRGPVRSPCLMPAGIENPIVLVEPGCGLWWGPSVGLVGAAGRWPRSCRVVHQGLSSGGLVVLVDEPAEDRPSPDRVDQSRIVVRLVDGVGASLLRAAVGSMAVVVVDVLVEERAELSLVPDHRVIEQLSADGSHETLDDGVGSWRAGWRGDDVAAFAGDNVVEGGHERRGGGAGTETGELAVDAAVVPRRVLLGEAYHELLAVASGAGPPGPVLRKTHRRAGRRRCQHRIVSGATMNRSGTWRDSTRANPAGRARSASVNSGRCP